MSLANLFVVGADGRAKAPPVAGVTFGFAPPTHELIVARDPAAIDEHELAMFRAAEPVEVAVLSDSSQALALAFRLEADPASQWRWTAYAWHRDPRKQRP